MIAYTACPPTSRWTTTTKAKPTFPCSAESAIASVKKWAGRLFTRNRRTACPGIRLELKTGTSCKSSRSAPNRENSIFCLCSCLTVSGVSLTKRLLWWNGLLRTASGSGVRRRVSSVLIITRTNSPTTSASGRLTAKAKRLQFAQKPLSASSSRTAVSRAVLLLMGMTL